jgi:hypothetical protein
LTFTLWLALTLALTLTVVLQLLEHPLCNLQGVVRIIAINQHDLGSYKYWLESNCQWHFGFGVIA